MARCLAQWTNLLPVVIFSQNTVKKNGLLVPRMSDYGVKMGLCLKQNVLFMVFRNLSKKWNKTGGVCTRDSVLGVSLTVLERIAFLGFRRFCAILRSIALQRVLRHPYFLIKARQAFFSKKTLFCSTIQNLLTDLEVSVLSSVSLESRIHGFLPYLSRRFFHFHDPFIAPKGRSSSSGAMTLIWVPSKC